MTNTSRHERVLDPQKLIRAIEQWWRANAGVEPAELGLYVLQSDHVRGAMVNGGPAKRAGR